MHQLGTVTYLLMTMIDLKKIEGMPSIESKFYCRIRER